METKSRTLLQYLTDANPDLLEAGPRSSSVSENVCPQTQQRSGGKSTTRSNKWPNLKEISKWKEFNWETLRNLFNNQLQLALNTHISGLHDFSYIQSPFRRIYNENALESLLIKSNQSIVLEALLKTPQDFLNQKVEMVRGGQAILMFDKSGKDMPDWAGLNERQRPNNILPGETKTSWAWKSTDIEGSNFRDGANSQYPKGSLWPLRQLLYYCICSFTRYGYIITDKELVVVRVGSREGPGVSEDDERYEAAVMERVFDNPVVDYLSIPWECTGTSSRLTINLALWILHVLAANNGHLQSTPYASLDDETLIPPNKQRTLRREELSFDMHQPLSFEEQETAQPEAYADQISGGSDTESSTDTTEADYDPLLLSHASSFYAQEVMSAPKRKRDSLSKVFSTAGGSSSIGSAVTPSSNRGDRRKPRDHVSRSRESGERNPKRSSTKRSESQPGSTKYRRKK